MIKIRKAKKEDLKQIAELSIILAMEISKKDFFKKNERIIKKTTKTSLSKILKNKSHTVLVVEDKNKIVGFITGRIRKEADYFKIKKAGFVNEIYIKKEYRKKGLGKKLIKSLLQEFKNKKIKICHLNVLSNNKEAIKLYQNLGFKENRKKMVKKI